MRLASIGLSQVLERNWQKNNGRNDQQNHRCKGTALIQEHNGAEIVDVVPDPLCLKGAANHGDVYGIQPQQEQSQKSCQSGCSGGKLHPVLTNSLLTNLVIAVFWGGLGFVIEAPLSLAAPPIHQPITKPTVKPSSPPQPIGKAATQLLNAQRQSRLNRASTKDKFNSSLANSSLTSSGAVRARSLRQIRLENLVTQNSSSNNSANIPANNSNNRISDTTWRVLGQPVMTFDLPSSGTLPIVPDTVAPEGSPQNTNTPTIPNAPVVRTLTPQQQRQQITERITALNQRLAEIVFSLNPEQPWRVDVQPVIIMVTPSESPEPNLPIITSAITSGQTPNPNGPRQTKPVPKPKPKPVPVVRSAIIRLEGIPLMEVSAEDVINQNSTSIMDLANSWASALQSLLDSLENRQRLFAVAGLPETILFQNATYGLNPQIALDRGLFRTNGERTQGFTVFWEVPPDNNAYKIPPGNYVFDGDSRRIFLLNRLMQFIPYSR